METSYPVIQHPLAEGKTGCQLYCAWVMVSKKEVLVTERLLGGLTGESRDFEPSLFSARLSSLAISSWSHNTKLLGVTGCSELSTSPATQDAPAFLQGPHGQDLASHWKELIINPYVIRQRVTKVIP